MAIRRLCHAVRRLRRRVLHHRQPAAPVPAPAPPDRPTMPTDGRAAGVTPCPSLDHCACPAPTPAPARPPPAGVRQSPNPQAHHTRPRT